MVLLFIFNSSSLPYVYPGAYNYHGQLSQSVMQGDLGFCSSSFTHVSNYLPSQQSIPSIPGPCQVLFLLSLGACVNSIPALSLQCKDPSLLALFLSWLQLSCLDFILCMHFMHINFMHHTEMFILTFSHNSPTKGKKSRKISYSAHDF